MSLQRLSYWVHRLHDDYTYVSDRDVHGVMEYWTEESRKVLDSKPWAGDCDTWACTLATILATEPCFNLHDFGIAFVGVNDPKGDHAILWYDAPTGERVWADCNTDAVQMMTGRDFTAISYMRMDDPQTWLAFEDD
ncbi:MAG: hypothetical protein R3301_16220 [Saprospiraceae bacterium]|nr:hypothetical protein [Saprospiraceae bacterium]